MNGNVDFKPFKFRETANVLALLALVDDKLTIFKRYHVEYLQTLLALAEIPATAIYSQLDPAARKINVAKFASK